MAPRSTLFRFVAVRPVQRLDGEGSPWRFLRLPGGEPITDFQHSLAGAGDRSAGRALALDCVDRDRYQAALPTGDGSVRALARFHTALRRGWLAGGRAGALEAATRAVDPRLPRGDDLDAVRLLLWDALFATFLTPSADPRDRIDFIGPLRSIGFIEDRAGAMADGALEDLLRSTAVIPSWVTGSEGGHPDPDSTEVGGHVQDP